MVSPCRETLPDEMRAVEEEEGRGAHTKNGRRSRSLPPRRKRKKKKRETDRKKVERRKEKGSDRSQSDLPLGKYTAAAAVTRSLLCLLFSLSLYPVLLQTSALKG